jgi:acyl-CoA reductase-like NAD-dependent aldehyde dehydrogenase
MAGAEGRVEMEKCGHFIDGKWIVSNDSLVSIDPATLEPIGSCGIGTEDEVKSAVTAARHALDSWRATPLKGRAGVLRSVAQHIRSNLDHVAGLISTEVGKPLFEARIEAKKAAGTLDFFADEARVYLEGRMIPVDEGIFRSLFPFGPSLLP